MLSLVLDYLKRLPLIHFLRCFLGEFFLGILIDLKLRRTKDTEATFSCLWFKNRNYLKVVVYYVVILRIVWLFG